MSRCDRANRQSGGAPLRGDATKWRRCGANRWGCTSVCRRVRTPLEDFDFHFNPEVPKSKVLDLATCASVERKINALLLGQTGVGKSHIAQALGHPVCRTGHRVLYISAQDLFRQLRAGRADITYDKKLLRITQVELLIIDDLGLRPLTDNEPIDRPIVDSVFCRQRRLLLKSVQNRQALAPKGTFKREEVEVVRSQPWERLAQSMHDMGSVVEVNVAVVDQRPDCVV